MPKNSRKKELRTEFRTVEYVQLGDLPVYGETDALPGGAGYYYISLAQLPNQAAYIALFDLYRITGLELTFMPTATMSAVINATEPPGGANPAYYVPCVHAATDFDLDTAPTGGAVTLMGYSSYRRQLLDKEFRYSLKPRVSIQAVQPGTITPTVATASATDLWMDTQDPGVRYAGVRVWVDPVSTASVALTPLKVRVYAKVSLDFANKV